MKSDISRPDPLTKQCADEHCGWLFIDKSRNNRRRWCGMNDCGNRAKAHRHYERKIQGKKIINYKTGKT